MRAPNIISKGNHSKRVLSCLVPHTRFGYRFTETSCDLVWKRHTHRPNTRTRALPPATGQTLRKVHRIATRHKRVPLFPSLVLLNPVPLSLAINPRTTRRSRVGSPHKWQQLPKPRHLMQFGHGRTSINMVICPDQVNGKNGPIKLSFGDGPDHMANAVRTGSGGQSKLERSASFFHLVHKLPRQSLRD